MIRSIYFAITVVFIFLASTSFAQESSPAQDKAVKTEQKHEMEASNVKELDSFHELIHPLVHEAYPNKDFSAIKKALPDLIKSARILKSANLPKELSAKNNSFKKESKKLLNQLSDLNKKKETLPDENFGKKFMELHDTFEKIMKLSR